MTRVVNWDSVNDFLEKKLHQEMARNAYATPDVAPVSQGRVQMLLELQHLEAAVLTLAAATESPHG